MTTNSLEMSRELLLGNVLRSAAHIVPDKVCFKFENQAFTYAQLERKALQLAGWIQQQGIKKDQKVAYIFKNSVEFVELMWAISLSGGVGVPLNFRLASDEVLYILNDSDTEILFIDQEYVDIIQSIRHEIPNVRSIIVSSEQPVEGMLLYSQLFDERYDYSLEQQHDHDACMIMYTSGTTGKPKGAVLTHKNLVMNSQNLIREFDLDSNTSQLVVAPLFHTAALASLVFCTLARGTTVIQKDFVPNEVLQAVQQEKITCLFLVPAMWNFVTSLPNIDDYDLSSVRTCIAGAETCPLKVKERIIEHFNVQGIYEAFGQTETSPVTICMKPADSMRKTAALGKPIVNVEVRIVDENMNDVPVGEIGEIVYRGPTIMKEYYKKPEETAAAFEGGWFHSGDLVSADEEGFIYIRDRKKDMIISAGENIYPAEIENVLYRHEAIFEAAVIGVPDAVWGESVKAFIVLKENQTLTKEEVIEFCVQHLASYKKPKYIEFIPSLPRNTSGKILKRALRDEAAVEVK
ncbi:class I adenylate-forming enzyme family protein [Lysinibacillus sp. 54212]|uniref:class I adenylate-forming enzyme family protein n=1 Tax=Lysinibacillus sp. 54212 TaxID=3119829 RepID=UPI002FC58574